MRPQRTLVALCTDDVVQKYKTGQYYNGCLTDSNCLERHQELRGQPLHVYSDRRNKAKDNPSLHRHRRMLCGDEETEMCNITTRNPMIGIKGTGTAESIYSLTVVQLRSVRRRNRGQEAGNWGQTSVHEFVYELA